MCRAQSVSDDIAAIVWIYGYRQGGTWIPSYLHSSRSRGLHRLLTIRPRHRLGLLLSYHLGVDCGIKSAGSVICNLELLRFRHRRVDANDRWRLEKLNHAVLNGCKVRVCRVI